MNCTKCNSKACRQMKDCPLTSVQKDRLVAEYAVEQNAAVLKEAAQLVDRGRAGTLSRFQEIIEFAKGMKYQNIGFAYCYGMEVLAAQIADELRGEGFKVSAVSCTIGGVSQNEINSESCIHNVSCNPIGQATQLNNEKVEMVLSMGLCLGHDILFNNYIDAPHSVLAVKDRIHNHNPLKEFNRHLTRK